MNTPRTTRAMPRTLVLSSITLAILALSQQAAAQQQQQQAGGAPALPVD